MNGPSCTGWRVFQEVKWNLRGYPLAKMLREATDWFPR